MTEAVYPNALLTRRSINQQESLDKIISNLNMQGHDTYLHNSIEEVERDICRILERTNDLEKKVKWNDKYINDRLDKLYDGIVSRLDKFEKRLEKIENGKAERIS